MVYVRTLAPSITWQNAGADSGDLVAAIFTGGIPHPPGYPLYRLITQIFLLLPVGSVAYRVNLFSAVSASLAVAVLFLILRGLLADRAGRNVTAAATALLFAFSPLFWSQATIAEVNAFHVLLVALMLGGLMGWCRALENRSGKQVQIFQWVVMIVLGLGIAHHPTIVLLLPAGLILLWGRAPTSDSSAIYRSLGRVPTSDSSAIYRSLGRVPSSDSSAFYRS
ncbi:MAG: DUF2723 domain-containing protein, partial [Chloroflexi bacterium]|nr:DUF2723 domain-containing protein [Chloroflexota bacterium]